MRNESTLPFAVIAMLAAASVTNPALARGESGFDGDSPTTSAIVEHAAPRLAIAARLMDIGYCEREATESALLLTPDDLAVLIEHPRILQRAAGAPDETELGDIVVAALVITAVVLCIVYLPSSHCACTALLGG